MADQYCKMLERETPIVSISGGAMDPLLSPEEWQALKSSNKWADYDYTKLFAPGGTNPTERVGRPSSSVTILKLE